MKSTVTYLIKMKETNLYIINRPTYNNPTVKYSTDKRDAREFNGLEDAEVDMNNHVAIKKVVTETTEYEEVDFNE
ncbi:MULTISPECIES: DUF2483 family protein [Staphylococcus]|uniref:Uncharacterized protein n=1 Tax=Staphylococcus carnosus TaxID=1281 RepID=A0AAJ0JPD2_STACA|nr:MULTISPECIES: DUF2483 family protein [Staphylococcus]ANZ33903.1 hypothetical protein BEK99_08930 [Staphylococcus carnosus]APR61452.1 hypothetical protein BTZ13_09590 [Staphylococcus condimenti]KKB24961.1 hypothetical protein VV61_07725 [Staphylococcus carnosus]POA02248.1 DUF2483 domain-containing protein [Staphylococcus carnosus]QQS85848.1 DUF2483 family protein [Staphylococcus carnosus]